MATVEVRNGMACNYNASAAPTVNDDTGDGYRMGSLWIDTTNNKAYICVDNASGAAVWNVLNAEDGADVTDATNVNAAGATMNADADVSGNSWVLDEDAMGSDSATKVATQQSVKAYADNRVGPDFQNLTVVKASADTVDVDFDKLQVGPYQLTAGNLTIDITASGKNGLDAGAQAGSRWYAVFVIYDPATPETAGLFSVLPSEAYTNDPGSGANVVLNVASTTGFYVGDKVRVSSDAGSEVAEITAIVTNTSITVDALGFDHTTTAPLIISWMPPGVNTWTPALPGSFTKWRHVGWVNNDSTPDFRWAVRLGSWCFYEQHSSPVFNRSNYAGTTGSWEGCDISAWIPPGTTAVSVSMMARDGTTGKFLQVSAYNTGIGGYNRFFLATAVADTWMSAGCVIPIDTDYKIDTYANDNMDYAEIMFPSFFVPWT